MTKLLIEESVVRQALEALGEAMSYMEAPTQVQPYVQTSCAITALRDAIENQPKVEPVAYLTQRTCDSFMVAGYETCEKGDYGSFPVYRHPTPAEDVQAKVEASWKVLV